MTITTKTPDCASSRRPDGPSPSVVGPIDLYPTVLDLLGIAKPEKQRFDGVSYAKVLKGEGQLDRTAYFNYFPHGGANKADGVWLRRGDFKLIRWFGNPNTHELYNLREDLGEAIDLAAKMPDRVKEPDALIRGFLRDTGTPAPSIRAPIPPTTQPRPRRQSPLEE